MQIRRTRLDDLSSSTSQLDIIRRNMKTLRTALSTGTLMLIAVQFLAAHHSFAEFYDREKPVTLTGTFVGMQWESPHMHFHISVTEADGRVRIYGIEGGPPRNLVKTGWTRGMLKAGDKVTVFGYMARDGGPRLSAVWTIVPDGRKLDTLY